MEKKTHNKSEKRQYLCLFDTNKQVRKSKLRSVNRSIDEKKTVYVFRNQKETKKSRSQLEEQKWNAIIVLSHNCKLRAKNTVIECQSTLNPNLYLAQMSNEL